MFFKDFVSVKRQKIKRGASQTYDTPSFFHLNMSVLLYMKHFKTRKIQILTALYEKGHIFAAVNN